MRPKDDAELDGAAFIELLKRGDPAAYRRLIRRFHGSLVGVASGIIGSRAQAEEVVQDAWLAVFSGIARFEGRSTLASWLFTIVLNRARSRVTRESRTVALPPILDGSQPGEHVVDGASFTPDGHWRDAPRLWDELDPERLLGGRQLWGHVLEIIEVMPSGQKAVIILRDIGALRGNSPAPPRVLLHRARARVRTGIDALGGGVAAPSPKSAPRAALSPRPARGGTARTALAQRTVLARWIARLHRRLRLHPSMKSRTACA
jgi:RNA polymerase sigma-70 factor (ECF subfamily)